MSFTTRDAYRHVVERVARKAERPEAEVADLAVKLATAVAHAGAPDSPQAHVGYYLVDAGRATLETRRRPAP